MSIFDPQGPWVFGNDGTRDEKEQEKEHQEEACRLMEQYQAYIGVIEEQQGVIRGSKLACDFGTDKVLLDMYEDHGVIKADSNDPIATCADCLPDNIHHFGSCLCPEKLYAGRLPMTKGSWGDGTSPKKATNNIYAHVCVPLIKKDQGWQQIGKDILIEVGYKKYELLLLDNAVLVCQYGGIIRILEVPDEKQEEENTSSKYGVDYELNEEEKLFIAVVAGESIGQGELGWQVVANMIMNRVGSREWAALKTPTEVMNSNHFDCLKEGGSNEYNKAVKYLENRVNDNGIYEQLISVVMPIYHGETTDITGGAQLYYSPRSMKPPGSKPWWEKYYKKVTVEGIDPNDFVLFTGERIQ